MEASNSGKLSSTHKANSVLVVIFISMLLDLLGFTLILPLLPSLFEYYSKNDKSGLYPWMESRVHYFQEWLTVPESFNTVLFSGVIGSLFSCLQFLSSPLLGALSDVYGRKPILIFSMCGMAVSYLLWAVSFNFTIFVFSRIVGGISKGNVGISAAVMADVLPQEKRGKGMALIGMAFSVGFIIGPVLGALFAVRGRHLNEGFSQTPALFALTLALVDALILTFLFKETLPTEKRAQSLGTGLSEAYKYVSPVSLFSFRPVQGISKNELFLLKRVGLVYFLFLFLYSGLEYSLTFLTHLRFQYTSMQQGKLYLFCGVVMSIIQGGFIRRIPAGKESDIALFGLLCVIPSFIIIGLASDIRVLYVGLFLYSVASATVVPCCTTLVSRYGSVQQKGTILGILRSLGSLSRALGPCIAAFAYWSLGPVITYCVGGMLLIVPLLLFWQVKKVNIPQKTD